MTIVFIIIAVLIAVCESIKDNYDAAKFHNSNTLEQKYPHTWGKK